MKYQVKHLIANNAQYLGYEPHNTDIYADLNTSDDIVADTPKEAIEIAVEWLIDQIGYYTDDIEIVEYDETHILMKNHDDEYTEWFGFIATEIEE